MPEHLRALAVILVVAGLVFFLAGQALAGSVIASADFRRRRNLWFAVTLIAFLSHSFWIYMLLCGALLLHARNHEPNPLAMYLMLLLAVPPFREEIPAFGVINYVFEIDHIRLLNLVILLPLAWRLLGAREGPRPPTLKLADLLVAVYLAYVLLRQMPALTLTMSMRTAFYLLLDVGLPYYVASRALRTPQAVREALVAFVIGVAVLALVAMLEALRSWMLYDALREALGLAPAPREAIIYLRRDGLLRAAATTGQAIVLGYVMMIALSLYTAVVPALSRRGLASLAALALAGGLLASLSRGPWVGAAVALVIAQCIGPGASRRAVWVLGGGGVLALALLASPMGDRLLDFLPFIGTVDEVNVDYRKRLFEVSMFVIWQNPWFGALDYITNPALEVMRQGQGIIDIVNSYLGIALAYGFVGLTLFLAPFMLAIARCWQAHRQAIRGEQPVAESLGRAFLGALIGVLITIATVASIGAVPTLYWLLLGLCIGYASGYASAAPRAAARSAPPAPAACTWHPRPP